MKAEAKSTTPFWRVLQAVALRGEDVDFKVVDDHLSSPPLAPAEGDQFLVQITAEGETSGDMYWDDATVVKLKAWVKQKRARQHLN